MARNSRAKFKRSDADKIKRAIDLLHANGYTVLTDEKNDELRNGITDFVMSRAYVMIMSAFIDNAKAFWKDLFKSKKAMRKYLKKSIDDVELHGQWISEDKAMHFDEISEWIYEEFGVDYRTAWVRCSKGEAVAEELTNGEHPDYWGKDSNWRSKDEEPRSAQDIKRNAEDV